MQNPEILIIGAAIIDVLARPVNTKVCNVWRGRSDRRKRGGIYL